MGKLEVDQDLIRQLAALLEETGLGEIEIVDDDKRLRVARPRVVVAAQAAPAATGPASTSVQPMPATGESEDLARHPGAIRSPMVGTCYRAPEPGAAPFVNVGDRVHKGQTVLVIEAMKTFNEIPAPRDGTVSRILVENASPVEFDEVLLLIE
jgi:acetyl-CoA carboxylase biotin carboxyl carrier protein